MSGDIEREARNMGWVSEEEFKGNKEKWVSAEEFVDKSKHVLPILLQNNKRLQSELLTRDTKIGNLETAFKKMETHFTEANKRALDTAREEVRKQLKSDLKKAREDEDVDAEADVISKLGKLDTDTTPVVTQTPAKGADEGKLDDLVSQEHKDWEANNRDWFGPDKKRTKAVLRLAEDLRDDEPDLKGKAFYDRLDELMEDQNGNQNDTQNPRPPSRTESGSRGGRSSGGANSYNSLPLDARQVCDSEADDFVGEGKMFKTVADWRVYYAKTYYGAG